MWWEKSLFGHRFTCPSYFLPSVGCLMPQSWSPNCLIQSGDSCSSGGTPSRNEDIFILCVMHCPFVKMHLAASSGLLLLAFLVAFCTSGALAESRDGNSTQNGTVAGGGFVPLAFTKVNQIIAREGSCVLIDCNVTGEPFPSFQWFNSHGERLDTESEGEPARSYDFTFFSPAQQNWISNKPRGRSG